MSPNRRDARRFAKLQRASSHRRAAASIKDTHADDAPLHSARFASCVRASAPQRLVSWRLAPVASRFEDSLSMIETSTASASLLSCQSNHHIGDDCFDLLHFRSMELVCCVVLVVEPPNASLGTRVTSSNFVGCHSYPRRHRPQQSCSLRAALLEK